MSEETATTKKKKSKIRKNDHYKLSYVVPLEKEKTQVLMCRAFSNTITSLFNILRFLTVVKNNVQVQNCDNFKFLVTT